MYKSKCQSKLRTSEQKRVGTQANSKIDLGHSMGTALNVALCGKIHLCSINVSLKSMDEMSEKIYCESE